jgi:hypothetical protein
MTVLKRYAGSLSKASQKGPIGGRRSSVHRLVSHSGIFADCLGQPFLPLGRLRQAGDHRGRPPRHRDNGPVAPRSRAAGCTGNRWRFI